MGKIILNSHSDKLSDILSLVDNPFIDRKNNDAISLIFHRFFRHTDIPLALPIFSFYSMISAWLVFNEAKMRIPYTPDYTELNTWVMALAASGANKTMSFKQIQKMIPLRPDGQGYVVEPNVSKCNGPKAMVMQLNEIQELHNNRAYWFQDEASQMFKAIEQPGSPMAELKEILLKIKDGDLIERRSAKDHIVAQGTVMVQFFINTLDSMVRTLSDESLQDGLFRRYQVAIAAQDSDRDFTDFPLYKLDKLIDETLKRELSEVFAQNVIRKSYEFSSGCINLYKDCFKDFWHRKYSKYLSKHQNIYRTYMMESWKYGVFHHVINKKDGTTISSQSLQYGLKVVVYLLDSLTEFFRYKAKDKPTKKTTNRLELISNFILENENKRDFSIRAVCRKFTIKKMELSLILDDIKSQNPEFKTKLFAQIAK